MHAASRLAMGLCVMLVAVLVLAGCRKPPEAAVVEDLAPWIKPADLPGAEAKAYRDFCRFLAVRMECDAKITSGTMTDKEAIALTQPLIDDLAEMGKPAEDVMIKLLEARQNLSREKREDTLLVEHPEVFATIVLWNQKSERAVPLLMNLAKDERIHNRAVFVRGLGRIGDPQALPLLRELARTESNLEVLQEAQAAVAGIEGTLPEEKRPPEKTPEVKEPEPKKPEVN